MSPQSFFTTQSMCLKQSYTDGGGQRPGHEGLERREDQQGGRLETAALAATWMEAACPEEARGAGRGPGPWKAGLHPCAAPEASSSPHPPPNHIPGEAETETNCSWQPGLCLRLPCLPGLPGLPGTPGRAWQGAKQMWIGMQSKPCC